MAVAVLLFSMSFSQAALADDIQTLGEYSGTGIFPDPGPYQPPTVVGTFTIDPGDTSLMISGFFGNSTIPDSSGVDVYLGSILVGQCVLHDACSNSGPPTPWSDTLTPSQITSLGTGLVNLTVVQTSQFTIQLGVTTLDQSQAAPEPSSLLMLSSGLLGLMGMAYRRKQIA